MINTYFTILNHKIYDLYFLFILCLIIFIVAVIILIISHISTISNPYNAKLTAYECGFEPYEDARNPFDIQFYILALLYLIFDIEIIYLYPWVYSILDLSIISFWTILDFIIELIIGYIYIWVLNIFSFISYYN